MTGTTAPHTALCDCGAQAHQVATLLIPISSWDVEQLPVAVCSATCPALDHTVEIADTEPLTPAWVGELFGVDVPA